MRQLLNEYPPLLEDIMHTKIIHCRPFKSGRPLLRPSVTTGFRLNVFQAVAAGMSLEEVARRCPRSAETIRLWTGSIRSRTTRRN